MTSVAVLGSRAFEHLYCAGTKTFQLLFIFSKELLELDFFFFFRSPAALSLTHPYWIERIYSKFQPDSGRYKNFAAT